MCLVISGSSVFEVVPEPDVYSCAYADAKSAATVTIMSECRDLSVRFLCNSSSGCISKYCIGLSYGTLLCLLLVVDARMYPNQNIMHA